jgi:thymidylate synthase
LEAGDFVHTLGDAHLYLNHIDQARTQLQRRPGVLPSININPDKKDIFGFVFDDFELVDYVAQDHIPAPVAV